jgi:hypothetical protein
LAQETSRNDPNPNPNPYVFFSAASAEKVFPIKRKVAAHA